MLGQSLAVPNWCNRLNREKNMYEEYPHCRLELCPPTEHGQIDVLINNAGLPGSITYPAWDPNNGTPTKLSPDLQALTNFLQRMLSKRACGKVSMSMNRQPPVQNNAYIAKKRTVILLRAQTAV